MSAPPDAAPQRLEPMPLGDRLALLVGGVLPPALLVGAVVGGAAWLVGTGGGRTAPSFEHLGAAALQSLGLAGLVALGVSAGWLLPALRDLASGKLLVAEGTLALENRQHTTSRGNTYDHWYCFVREADGHDSPACAIGKLRAVRLHRRAGRQVRLYIAPKSRRLVHLRTLQ